MKVEPFLISSTLNVILAQRLVRRLCQNKEKYYLKESELKNLAKYCDLNRILEILREEKLVKPNQTFDKIPFYRPKSTKDCPEGYKGRIGIFEVLPVTEAIKDLIVKQAPADQIQTQAQKEGMRTMIEDGFVKAAQGITSIEEVLRVIIE
jgi:type II secretory ATPase GspE/PulE/Tfp pilus assembly ATPase PilB-like protein